VDTFKKFYIESKDGLFAYLIRMTGDYPLSSDILQESYTRLLSSYGPSEKNQALLYRIARNALIDSRRRTKREVGGEERDIADERNPEKDLMIRESYRKVIKAMDRLEETERDVLSLSVSGDFSYRDIAGITGISEINVRVKIHRARTKLKEMLGAGKEEDRP
jgi:RNA polymerase sigma-70 factor (ECF subfamily)